MVNNITLVLIQSAQIEIEIILALNCCVIDDSFNLLTEFVHNEINTE